MKKFALLAVIISCLSFIAGLYLLLIVIPEKENAEAIIFQPHDIEFYTSLQYHQLFDTISAATDFAMIVLTLGIFSFGLSIIPAIKKVKIAWLGVVLAILTTFFGMVYGTHMF